jgi:hypothetical protein
MTMDWVTERIVIAEKLAEAGADRDVISAATGLDKWTVGDIITRWRVKQKIARREAQHG